MGESPADGSLLTPRESSTIDVWRGWGIQTTQDGRLFYYHASSSTSQWQQPRELSHVLGEWVRAGDGAGNVYWRNELLGISSWKDPRQATSLSQAAVDGNVFFLRLYAYASGDLDVVDVRRRTALHYAAAAGAPAAPLCLLDGRASVDCTDDTGSTALHWACRYGRAAVVHILLKANADPNLRNSVGDTPLHEAASVSATDVLQRLLVAHADPMLRDHGSRTAAEVATQRGAAGVVELLQRHEDRHLHAQQRYPCRPASLADAERAVLDSLEPGSASDGGGSSGSDSEIGDSPVSPALKIVRAARPLLRTVQWLANIVPMRSNLGASNSYCYDQHSGRWVFVQRPPSPGASSSSDDSGWSPRVYEESRRLPASLQTPPPRQARNSGSRRQQQQSDVDLGAP